MAPRFTHRLLDRKATLVDGTLRTTPLATTWQKFSTLAPVAGITRLADLTGLDSIGIPVWTAIRPRSRSLSTQQGKGLTPLAAKVSALMESLETWAAETVAERKPIVRATVAEVGARAIDVKGLARGPGKLGRSTQLQWIAGWDLAADRDVYVPLDAVTLDTTFTAPPVFDISSNGLASGNDLVEAIVHGLCEVLERDAEAAWRRSGGDRRLVLDTIPDPACRGLIDRITKTGARVFVWHLPTDASVCVIGAAIVEDPREPAWRALGCYQGFGAHLRPEIAIARALTEAAQTRVTYIAGGRDDFFAADYARATDPEILADLWERLAAPCDEPVLFEDLPRAETRSLGRDLEVLMRGLDSVVVVDLSHAELPVVKVIVPGRATDVEALG
ncbi:MAG TPA: YcaO-like family protein [Kofleriaceae bacterium]